MSERELEMAFYRAMQRNNAYLDPFTVMEIITLIKPIAGISLDTLRSSEKFSLKLQSVLEHMSYVFKKFGVEDPENTAENIVKEVLDYCLKACPRDS